MAQSATHVPSIADDAAADAVLARALEGLDLNDRDIRLAVQDFHDARRKALAEAGAGEVLASLTSPDLLSLVADCHHAQIQRRAAVRLAKLADQRSDLAIDRLMQAIRESGLVDPDGDWILNLHRLVVIDTAALRRDVLRFAKKLVAIVESPEARDAAMRAEVPADVRAAIAAKPDLGEFIKDLVEHIREADASQRQRLMDIVHTPAIAARWKDDGEIAPPVRFLASLVAKFDAE